jgi:Zn-dependent protease
VHVAVGQHCVGCLQGRPAAGQKGLAAFKIKRAVVGVVVGADEDARLRRPGAVFYGLLVLFLGLIAVGWFGQTSVNEGLALNSIRVVAIAIVIVGAVIGLSIHEWAHAFVAYHGGDKTVLSKGYLTLDVRNYSDPLLSFGFPILFLFLGGLPLPGGAVWINHAHLRSRAWDSAVSLAGPASNVAFGLLLIGVNATGVFAHHPALSCVFTFLATLQFAIAILNMLPIPGLDGYGVIEPYLPDSVASFLAPARQLTMVILLLLFMNGAVSSVLWDGAFGMSAGLGVDRGFIATGAYLASPQLF